MRLGTEDHGRCSQQLRELVGLSKCRVFCYKENAWVSTHLLNRMKTTDLHTSKRAHRA